jgi:hypothetical protein
MLLLGRIPPRRVFSPPNTLFFLDSCVWHFPCDGSFHIDAVRRHGERRAAMTSYEMIETTVEDLIAEFCEETQRRARNAKEADTAAANFLTGILHNAEPISKHWH